MCRCVCWIFVINIKKKSFIMQKNQIIIFYHDLYIFVYFITSVLFFEGSKNFVFVILPNMFVIFNETNLPLFFI